MAALDGGETLRQVRGALAVMLNPRSAPLEAKEASDWLHDYRNDNEARQRRVKRTALGTRAAAWPTLVALLTAPGTTPPEQLFAAQGLLYRLQRFEIADALDVDDPVALALPPSSSAKPSDEATARANEAAMRTLGTFT